MGLGQQQPFNHPRPQPKGTALGAIGGAEQDVGMGLKAPELGGQFAEGFSAVSNRNRTPGAHAAPASQAIQIRQAQEQAHQCQRAKQARPIIPVHQAPKGQQKPGQVNGGNNRTAWANQQPGQANAGSSRTAGGIAPRPPRRLIASRSHYDLDWVCCPGRAHWPGRLQRLSHFLRPKPCSPIAFRL